MDDRWMVTRFLCPDSIWKLNSIYSNSILSLPFFRVVFHIQESGSVQAVFPCCCFVLARSPGTARNFIERDAFMDKEQSALARERLKKTLLGGDDVHSPELAAGANVYLLRSRGNQLWSWKGVRYDSHNKSLLWPSSKLETGNCQLPVTIFFYWSGSMTCLVLVKEACRRVLHIDGET